MNIKPNIVSSTAAHFDSLGRLPNLSLEGYTRGIQKVLRQILKNTLFMKFTKLFPSKYSVLEFFDGNIAYRSVMNWMESM